MSALLAACGGGGGGSSASPSGGQPPTSVTPTAAPSAKPSPTSAPTVAPTAAPSPSSNPVPGQVSSVAFMNPGTVANSLQGTIAQSSTVGVVDIISATEITTTSGANPSIATDPISLKLSTSASTFAHSRLPTTYQHPRLVSIGTLRAGRVTTAVRHTATLGEPDERRFNQAFLALRQQSTVGGTVSAALRHPLALPITVGGTNSFFVNTGSIGQSSATYASVPATLQAISNHGYIWIDNSLTLSQASIAQIAKDFDNAYASDMTHFGTPEFLSTSPGAQGTLPPCDSKGNFIAGAPSAPIVIAPPNGHHVLFVINTAALGTGVGGYFSNVNYLTQAAANCFSGQPKSNEASMIYVGYDTSSTDAVEVNEDIVRGTAHEFQHLINFVNHGLLSNVQLEDTWINEGLSMLAQDFAVNALFPQEQVDVDDALFHAQTFMDNPQNYSLTGFTGIDQNTSTLKFGCTGCYGQSYLFQRYLYDQYGGDVYTRNMESGGTVSFAGLLAQTHQDYATLIKNFSVALLVSNSGLSNAPQFNFNGFNPYGSYTDQFGQNVTLAGPGVFTAAPGTTTNYTPYVGTFSYVKTQLPTGQGSGVTVTDQGGNFNLSSALVQF